MKVKNAKARTAENTPKVCGGCDEKIPHMEARWYAPAWWHTGCRTYHEHLARAAG